MSNLHLNRDNVANESGVFSQLAGTVSSNVRLSLLHSLERRKENEHRIRYVALVIEDGFCRYLQISTLSKYIRIMKKNKFEDTSTRSSVVISSLSTMLLITKTNRRSLHSQFNLSSNYFSLFSFSISGQSAVTPKTYYSTGTTLTLQFFSDSNNQGEGWIATVRNL